MPVHRRCTQWLPPALHSTEIWLPLIPFLHTSHVQTVSVGPGLDSTSPLRSSSSTSHMTGSMGWVAEKMAAGPPFREARIGCADLALRVEGSPRRRRRQRVRGVDSCIFLDTSTTFTVPLIYSFLILSLLVTPTDHLSIFISATSIFFSSFFFIGAASKP